MPSRSKSQSRLFHWADAHPAEAAARGIKHSVAHEFVEADHGKSLKGLPERVTHKARGGAVKPSGPKPFKW